MTAKECRDTFNKMITALQQDPTAAPAEMHVSAAMFQMQALWEIAAQLAEANEREADIHRSPIRRPRVL